MEQIERIAEAALQGDGLMTRSLVQDFFRSHPRLTELSKPATEDQRLLAACEVGLGQGNFLNLKNL